MSGQKNEQNLKHKIKRKSLIFNTQLACNERAMDGQKSAQKHSSLVLENTLKQERRLRNVKNTYLPPFIFFSATKQKEILVQYSLILPLSNSVSTNQTLNNKQIEQIYLFEKSNKRIIYKSE